MATMGTSATGTSTTRRAPHRSEKGTPLMGQRLQALTRQFDDLKSGIAKIEKVAVDAGRDLNDTEQTDLDALFSRAEAIKPDIDREAAREESFNATAAVLARVGAAAPAPAVSRAAPADLPLPSLGEYMVASIRAKQGDDAAAEWLSRAVPEEMTTADTPGILPVPIVGPLIKLSDSRRPVWNSFTNRPMPAGGKTFTRPRITQHVLVAEQVAELDELATRKMIIAGDPVTKRTFGGVLEISEQDIDWTDPSAMQIVIQDFVDVYAEVTEAAAVATLMTLAAAPLSPWTATDVGTMITSITDGFAAIYPDAKRMPDTLWLSLDEALTLAGTTNATTNVSAMSLIRQALTDAGLSLNIVVSPSLPPDTRILGASSLVESYENIKGLVQAPDVSHLGVFMAYRGYAATFGLAAGFIRLGA